MAEATLRIPTEQADWFRKQVKESMISDAETGFPASDQITREATIDTQERINRYVALLDQMGWSDDGSAKQVTLDEDLARDLITEGLEGMGEDMLVATGHYESDPFSASKVAEVGQRSEWLARTQEALGAEAVAV